MLRRRVIYRAAINSAGDLLACERPLSVTDLPKLRSSTGSASVGGLPCFRSFSVMGYPEMASGQARYGKSGPGWAAQVLPSQPVRAPLSDVRARQFDSPAITSGGSTLAAPPGV